MSSRLLGSALSRLTALRVGAMTKKTPKRNFSSTPAAWSHFQQKAIPGANLPFDIHNRYKLTLWTFLYFASGLNAPFFIIRFQLWKK